MVKIHPFHGISSGEYPLKSISVSDIAGNNDFALGLYNTNQLFYKWNATSTTDEDIPNIINPTDNTGAGRWELNNIVAKTINIDEIDFALLGITNGQVLTYDQDNNRIVGSTPNSSDENAIHVNGSEEINGLDTKNTLVNDDALIIEDSEDGWTKKKFPYSNISSDDGNAIHVNTANEISVIAEKTELSSDDNFIIEDSTDTNNKKRVKFSNFFNSNVDSGNFTNDDLSSGLYTIAHSQNTMSPIVIIIDENGDYAFPDVRPLTGTTIRLDFSSLGSIAGTWQYIVSSTSSNIGSGDVVGPASSTDNTIPRFNGTDGKTLQSSNVVVDDSDNVSGINELSVESMGINSITQFTGVISPSEITANQNNYNPTNLAISSIIRLSTDSSRDITGLQGGANGRLIFIHNIGNENIVFKNANSNSDAANRFDIGADFTLGSKKVGMFHYDSTSARWRVIGGSSGMGNDLGVLS